MKICFIVNPIAGIGGRPGLKGSDGVADKALILGGRPLSPIKSRLFLKSIGDRYLESIEFLTASGVMGGSYLSERGAKYKVVHVVGGDRTSAKDTKEAVRRCLKSGARLVVFVGGDGTARDVLDAVGEATVPILGVPAGVKVYSSVFAYTPKDAARIVEKFLEGKCRLVLREVIDADERLLRENRLDLKLYGYARSVDTGGGLQPSKGLSAGGDEEQNKEGIARFFLELMERDVLYILGPGTTIGKICELLGEEKTLLGVDLMVNGRIIARDVGEGDILNALENFEKVRVVVSPLGRQGFILGRGNQQISPEVLRKVGVRDLVVVATRSKIAKLKALRVDTGDPSIDRKFRGYVRVMIDYNQEKIVKVV